MLICRTVGMVVSTIKEDSLRSNKLLLVRQQTPAGEFIGEPFVAVDVVGAGENELVLIAIGSAAREIGKTRDTPVDAAIIGIIDSTSSDGGYTYTRTG